MTHLRLVQMSLRDRPLVVVLFHLTAAYDSKIREALGPDVAIVNLTLPSGQKRYSEHSLLSMGALAEAASNVHGRPCDIAALVGFSEGCQALRTYLLRDEAPAALIACDGTHGSWPARLEARELTPWRKRFEAALNGDGLFVASHSGLTYVEALKPSPYASTWRVLREVSGWPLEVPKGSPRPIVHTEGTATIYSTDAPDHIAQARDILPRMLRERLVPYLSELLALQADQLGQAPTDPPPAPAPAPPAPAPVPPAPPLLAGSRRVEAHKTPWTRQELCTALAASWAVVTGQPPTRAAVDLAAAQICLETGNGGSCWNFNLGNVKATPKWQGDHCYFACNEILKNGVAAGYVARARPRTDGKPGPDAAITKDRGDGTSIVWFYPDNAGCCFRSFRTLNEGVADHLALLQRRFKSAWPALLSGDAIAFVRALRNAGYFTADEAPYLKGVQGVLQSIKKIDYPLPQPATAEASACADGLCDEERDRVLACLDCQEEVLG